MCSLLDLQDSRSIYECLSGCVFEQCVYVREKKVCWERFADDTLLMCKNPKLLFLYTEIFSVSDTESYFN